MSEFTAPGVRDVDPFAGDPDLSDVGAEEVSDLDDLRSEIEAEVNESVSPVTVIPVLGRPRYTVRFRTDFTGQDIDSLRKRARNKRMSEGIDGVKFAALLLAFACKGILRDGEEMSGSLGVDQPVVFTTTEFQAILGTGNADETVRKFYGLEGHVDAAARRLMAEAGWGEEFDALDPTE